MIMTTCLRCLRKGRWLHVTSALLFVRFSATKHTCTHPGPRPLQAVSLPGDFESAIKETQAAILACKFKDVSTQAAHNLSILSKHKCTIYWHEWDDKCSFQFGVNRRAAGLRQVSVEREVQKSNQTNPLMKEGLIV